MHVSLNTTMLETLKKDWRAKVLVVLFLFLTVWWALLQFPQYRTPILNSTFGYSYGIIALWGAICGIATSRRWGGMKSVFGKAILMFAIGLLAQEFGQLAYFYYFFVKHVQVPYPSIGDLGFFGSIPFYSFGVILLGKASGVALRIKSIKHILPALIITFGMLAFGYILFLQHYTLDWSTGIKVFLDFGYPLGEAVYISLAISVYILSNGILSGIMKNKILLILFALCLQFSADYIFLYQSNAGVWTAGGLNDYLYLLAYTVMALGLIQLRSTVNN